MCEATLFLLHKKRTAMKAALDVTERKDQSSLFAQCFASQYMPNPSAAKLISEGMTKKLSVQPFATEFHLRF